MQLTCERLARHVHTLARCVHDYPTISKYYNPKLTVDDGGRNSHWIQGSPWPRSIPAEILVHEVLLRKDWVIVFLS